MKYYEIENTKKLFTIKDQQYYQFDFWENKYANQANTMFQPKTGY